MRGMVKIAGSTIGEMTAGEGVPLLKPILIPATL